MSPADAKCLVHRVDPEVKRGALILVRGAFERMDQAGIDTGSDDGCDLFAAHVQENAAGVGCCAVALAAETAAAYRSVGRYEAAGKEVPQ